MLQVVVVGMGGCICNVLQDVMVVTKTQRYTRWLTETETQRLTENNTNKYAVRKMTTGQGYKN